VSAVTRLVDMGVEPFLLASSLIGIGAQRLVRKLCMECRKPATPDAEQLRMLGRVPADGKLYTAQGCDACRKTGYHGRTGIYELVMVDDPLRQLIHTRAPEQGLREYALAHGMRPMREDGMRWVAQGLVSLEEVLRVTGE
jgi:general secretion pathway protein E